MDKALLRKLLSEINAEDALEAMGFSFDTEEKPVEIYASTTTTTEWYDITDEKTRLYLIEATPCWGTFAPRDEECGRCPLAHECRLHTETEKNLRAAERADDRALKARLEALGIELKGLKKIPAHESGRFMISQADCVCEISQKPIEKGDEIYYQPGIGVVMGDLARYLVD